MSNNFMKWEQAARGTYKDALKRKGNNTFYKPLWAESEGGVKPLSHTPIQEDSVSHSIVTQISKQAVFFPRGPGGAGSPQDKTRYWKGLGSFLSSA